jgi:hypothetical protein
MTSIWSEEVLIILILSFHNLNMSQYYIAYHKNMQVIFVN